MVLSLILITLYNGTLYQNALLFRSAKKINIKNTIINPIMVHISGVDHCFKSSNGDDFFASLTGLLSFLLKHIIKPHKYRRREERSERPYLSSPPSLCLALASSTAFSIASLNGTTRGQSSSINSAVCSPVHL